MYVCVYVCEEVVHSSQPEQEMADIPLTCYRSLLASLSDSSRQSTSPSLTGPFTFLIMVLPSSRNSTRTCTEEQCTHAFSRTQHHRMRPLFPLLAYLSTLPLRACATNDFDDLWKDMLRMNIELWRSMLKPLRIVACPFWALIRTKLHVARMRICTRHILVSGFRARPVY